MNSLISKNLILALAVTQLVATTTFAADETASQKQVADAQQAAATTTTEENCEVPLQATPEAHSAQIVAAAQKAIKGVAGTMIQEFISGNENAGLEKVAQSLGVNTLTNIDQLKGVTMTELAKHSEHAQAVQSSLKEVEKTLNSMEELTGSLARGPSWFKRLFGGAKGLLNKFAGEFGGLQGELENKMGRFKKGIEQVRANNVVARQKAIEFKKIADGANEKAEIIEYILANEIPAVDSPEAAAFDDATKSRVATIRKTLLERASLLKEFAAAHMAMHAAMNMNVIAGETAVQDAIMTAQFASVTLPNAAAVLVQALGIKSLTAVTTGMKDATKTALSVALAASGEAAIEAAKAAQKRALTPDDISAEAEKIQVTITELRNLNTQAAGSAERLLAAYSVAYEKMEKAATEVRNELQAQDAARAIAEETNANLDAQGLAIDPNARPTARRR